MSGGSESETSRVWRSLRRDHAAMTSLGWLCLVLVLGALSSVITPYDPAEIQTGPPFAGPSFDHWLGTDDLGRDTLSRLISGAGVAMRFSLVVVVVAILVAIPIGILAGYLGGTLDLVLMRIMDGIMGFPALVLAVVLVAVLGLGLQNAMIAIAIAIIPGLVRLVRGQVLAIKEEPFIEASRAIGTSQPRIVWRHVIPNVLSPVIVQASILFGAVILAESSLSFLGLGVQPPDASWGSMVQRSYAFVLSHTGQVFPPAIAIALTVLAFNILGDGLRAAFVNDHAHHGWRGPLGLTQVESDRRPVPPAVSVPLLKVDGLSVDIHNEGRWIRVVDDVSFSISAGETLGLLGESGCGKTVTSLAIMRLLGSPPARIAEGHIFFEGVDLCTMSFAELASRRGFDLSMVFQDPMSSLTPTMTIRRQLAQVVRWHEQVSHKTAKARAYEALDMVGIPRARADAYPHEFSGGMQQRAMLAMALICRPRLLIADEPTTALDVTIQAQVLETLHQLRDEIDMAMLFVTHDMGVVADICDRVVVMYAGQVVETAPVRELFHAPRHPYTQGLLQAMPQRGMAGASLYAIPGQVPQLDQLDAGCRFAARCQFAEDRCREAHIQLVSLSPVHAGRCIRIEQDERQ